jgi:charged multivesicular body protein 1
MEKVVHTLCKAIEGEKLVEMTKVMDDFERQMENASVQSACMDAALSSTTAITTPPDQVDGLLQQVADEHGLAISLSMPTITSSSPQVLNRQKQEELTERLAKLRQ